MDFVGKQLIFIGIIVMFVGFLILSGNTFSWFGTTFADFSFKGKNFNIFIPIGSMLIVSLILTIFINIFNKFFK